MLTTADFFPKITIGFDVGDRKSRTCEVDASGNAVRQATVATTAEGVLRYFGGRECCRVVLEAGTHSPWLSRQLLELGHEVIVANPGEVYGPRRRKKRNDASDAEFLARQGRADPKLLHPIQHRGVQAQEDLALLRARDQLVKARTSLICHVRGAVKSVGQRVGKCSAEAFARRAMFELPAELRIALQPLVELIGELTGKIVAMDRQVERVAQKYPEVARLRAPQGVGVLTALGYVLVVEDPKRFKRSRQVGAFLGLVPKLDESSGSSPQLRITKAGDELGRRLLVSAAQYILGPHGPDCDLRRHGEAIAARGGRNAKKRAAVAVARKLAVMLHRIWLSGEAYDPDYVAKRRVA